MNLSYQDLEAICTHEGGPYIFRGKKPLSTQTVSQIFDCMIASAGVKRIRLHNLRQIHASVLLNNPTISVSAVSARLANSNITTAMSVYTHVIDKAAKSLNDKIADMSKINKFSKNLPKSYH